ncbi:MAG: DUF1614 domain-containing protein [Ignisphaera sp.]
MNTKIHVLFIATIIVYSFAVLKDISIAIAVLIVVLSIDFIRLKASKNAVSLIVRRIALDLRGAVVPLVTSTLMALWSFQSIDYLSLFFLISLAIALSSLNTIITSKFFAINILRYVMPYFILTSFLYGGSEFYPHVLPLVTQLGIIIGSDILHGVYFTNEMRAKMLIIGGAGEYDAIYVSTIAIEWLEIFCKSLTTLICLTKSV